MNTVLVVPGRLAVIDNVIPRPLSYREAALEATYGDVTDGPHTFRGLAVCDDPQLPSLLMKIMPAGALPMVSFFRKSPVGQDEPHYIHTDAMMGDWTAILYLTKMPAEGDGTLFWRTKGDHQDRGTDIELASLKDRDLWERWHTVEARFNRLLIFKSDLYHSRAIEANYGHGDDARLIQVVFGKGPLPA